jgi:protein gp37
MPTKIQWTDETWNCVRGCSRVSAGCGDSTGGGCYAERQAYRFSGPGMPYEDLVKMTTKGPRWTGKVVLVEDKLNEPLHWKKPRRIFVNSMSDLFHESLSFGDIFRVVLVMQQAPQHVFQVLTKRPARMKEFFEWMAIWGEATALAMNVREYYEWPYPNTWLGTSVEDQKTADERIPLLMEVPAAVRWISAEPLLGPIDLESVPTMEGSIDWVVVGGESGAGARPMHPDWARSLRDQCVAAGVPFFFKQWGEWARTKGLTQEQRDKARPVVIFPDGHTEETLRHGAGRNERAAISWRVGKKAAGRLLDGREWNEFPKVESAACQ